MKINLTTTRLLKNLTNDIEIRLLEKDNLESFSSYVWYIYNTVNAPRYQTKLTENEKQEMILEDRYFYENGNTKFIAAVHGDRLVGSSRLIEYNKNFTYPVEKLININSIPEYLESRGFGKFHYLYDNGRWTVDNDYLHEQNIACPELFPNIFYASYAILKKDNSVIFGELDKHALMVLKLRNYPVKKIGNKMFTLGSEVFPVILPREERILEMIPYEYFA